MIGKIFSDVIDGGMEEAPSESSGTDGRLRIPSPVNPPYQPRVRSPRPRSYLDSTESNPAQRPLPASRSTSGYDQPSSSSLPTQTLWDRVSSEILGPKPSPNSTYPGNHRPQEYHLNHPGEYLADHEGVEEANIDYAQLQEELDKRDAFAK